MQFSAEIGCSDQRSIQTCILIKNVCYFAVIEKITLGENFHQPNVLQVGGWGLSILAIHKKGILLELKGIQKVGIKNPTKIRSVQMCIVERFVGVVTSKYPMAVLKASYEHYFYLSRP